MELFFIMLNNDIKSNKTQTIIHPYISITIISQKDIKTFCNYKSSTCMLKIFQVVQKYKNSFPFSSSLSVKSIVDILPHRSTSFLEDILNKYTIKYTSMYRYIHIYYKFVTYKYSILPILYKYNKYIITEQRTGLPRKGPVAILLSHLGNTGLDDLLSLKFYG